MSSLCYDAMTLWQLGFGAQANNREQEALALARGSAVPFRLHIV